jgi:hypothetical protein
MSSKADPSEVASKADTDLAHLGSELADAVVGAVPKWISGAVRDRASQWVQSGGGTLSIDQAELARMADSAGERAAAAVAGPLRELLSADVDLQWTTPLALVRPLVAFATEVLYRAGVPGVVRDEFQATKFPDDEYALTPASLSALGEEVATLALTWGAAKAMAHRLRHEG